MSDFKQRFAQGTNAFLTPVQWNDTVQFMAFRVYIGCIHEKTKVNTIPEEASSSITGNPHKSIKGDAAFRELCKAIRSKEDHTLHPIVTQGSDAYTLLQRQLKELLALSSFNVPYMKCELAYDCFRQAKTAYKRHVLSDDASESVFRDVLPSQNDRDSVTLLKSQQKARCVFSFQTVDLSSDGEAVILSYSETDSTTGIEHLRYSSTPFICHRRFIPLIEAWMILGRCESILLEHLYDVLMRAQSESTLAKGVLEDYQQLYPVFMRPLLYSTNPDESFRTLIQTINCAAKYVHQFIAQEKR